MFVTDRADLDFKLKCPLLAEVGMTNSLTIELLTFEIYRTVCILFMMQYKCERQRGQ